MRLFLFLTSLLLYSVGSSQVDLNNYATLLSSGPIPEDFTLNTYEKLDKDVAESFENLSRKEKVEFYTGINYTVDALLHSGSVIYGDPITKYVEAVAKRLLVKDKKLFRELRFYTIKSNSTNAFSTDQGIVFVTTGLLSQISSEAQLAYILAHEIAHYQQKHVLDSYTFNRSNSRAGIEKMSVYSQDKELEADKLAVEMYARAGYSKDEIIPTFDVLLYSYLPFDEVEVPFSYLTDFDSLFVPESLYPEEPYAIKAVEDEDDSRSSHPNIKTRKEAVQPEIERIKNWRNDIYKLGRERFREIQDIARFEVVRIDMHYAHYADAIYSIFLLERMFPTSLFLQRMKAQAWLGVLQYRLDNSIFSIVDRKSKLEGASGNIHHFIKEMSKNQLITMSVRQIASVKKALPDDSQIAVVYDRMIYELATTDKFDLNDYYEYSFRTAYNRAFPVNDTLMSDSSSVETDFSELGDEGELDEEDFHLYLIPDVITDSGFVAAYDKHHKVFLEQKKQLERYQRMSAKEKYYYDKRSSRTRGFDAELELNHIINMEPIVIKYGNKGIRYLKSEKTKEMARECIDLAAQKADLQISHLDREVFRLEGTQAYNDYCILKNFLEQSANNTSIRALPVDFLQVRNIEEKFGSSYVMYSVASHRYVPDLATSGTLYSVLFFPSIPFYFPIKLFSGHLAEMNMIILDTKTGKSVGIMSHKFNSTLRKHVLGAHVYSLFDSIKNN